MVSEVRLLDCGLEMDPAQTGWNGEKLDKKKIRTTQKAQITMASIGQDKTQRTQQEFRAQLVGLDCQ
jgi:hypothetical protein